MAAGGVREALSHAQQQTPAGIPIEIEVESLNQLREALDAGARMILLDNFGLDRMREALRALVQQPHPTPAPSTDSIR